MLKHFILIHNILWMFNFNLPFIYLIFIRLIKIINLKKPFVQLIFFFIFLQFISVLFSITNEFIDEKRFVGIVHNIFVFSFILIGMNIAYRDKYMNTLYQKIDIAIYFTFILSIISVFLFFYLQSNIEYNFLGKHIGFMTRGYILDDIFPRLSIFSDYANGTAIFIYLLSSIFIFSPKFINLSIVIKIFFLSLFIILIIFTGSRIILAMALGLFVITLVKQRFSYILFVFLGVLIIFYLIHIDFLDIVLSSRQGSSDMRMRIYTTSLETMMQVNPFTGLGLKPYVESIPNLPLGSHSSLIGYFTKNGLFVGLLYLLFNLYLLFQFISTFIFYLLGKVEYKQFYLSYIAISTFIIFLFEDLDAYEINSLLTGIVLGLLFKYKRKISIKT